MARFRFKAVAPTGQVVEGEMTAPLREMVIDQLRSRQHLPVRVEEVADGEAERVEPAVTAPPEMASDRAEPALGRAPEGEHEPAGPQLVAPTGRKPEAEGRIITVSVRRDWSGEERRRDSRGMPPPDTGERRKARLAEPPAADKDGRAEPAADEVVESPRAEPPAQVEPFQPIRWRPPASAGTDLTDIMPAPPAPHRRQELTEPRGEARYRVVEPTPDVPPAEQTAEDKDPAEPPPRTQPAAPAPEKRPRKAKRRAAMPARLQPVFTRELQVLLSAGLPVDQSLKIIVESTADDRVAAAADTLLTRVRGGAVLSEAMDTMPEQFDEFLRTAVRAGEAGGALGDVLDQVAAYQERGARLIRAVRTALIYPAVLAFAAALSVVLLLTLVVPQFELLFQQAGQAPPLVTRVVIKASALLRQYGWIVPVAGLILWFAGRLRFGNLNRRARLDRRLLRLPLLGPLIAAVSVERFARSAATLLANGVALPDTLALVAETLPNRAIGAAVAASVERVKQGERLADALEDGRAMPLLAVQLIRVGEEGGRLTEMLARLSAIYAADVDVAVRRLIAIIEPALILAIGAVVGGIILSLLAAVTGINALAL
ncbi:MAG: type II secretion system F family protein [Rhodospirillales bacterium]